MCGITGIINLKGLTESNMNYFDRMMLRAQIRGVCASGAFNTDGNMVKMPGSYDEHLRINKSFHRFVKGTIGATGVIGHTRMSTQGDPAKNSNNHPFSVKTKKGQLVLVHNGWVFDVPGKQTDTLAIVKDFKRVLNSTANFESFLYDYTEDLNGAAVLVFLVSRELYFFRTGYNTLYFSDSGAFASTEKILGRKAAFKLDDGEVFSISV